MQRLLIILGLVIVPFYEIILRIFPFAVVSAPDSRVTKEEIALVFALSIGLLAVFHGTIKPFRNKFLLIIPVYLLINLIMSPHAPLMINNNEVGDFYFWKPFAEILCFSLMVIAISSIEINFDEILKVMVICGALMAGYVILQKLGMDQFWIPKTDHDSLCVRGEALGGNLGQPTMLASWLVMMIPLAFYLRKWWMAGLIIIGCLLTEGAMVALAIGTIWIISVFCLYKELRTFIIVLLVIGIGSSVFILSTYTSLRNKAIIRMDGRYEVWRDTLKDIHNGQIEDGKKTPITGVGLGRFSFIFPMKNHSKFFQAHNDPMEFIYDCGLIGGFLLFAALFFMIRGLVITPLSLSILLSFIAIFICSLGSFSFQLGANQFYSAILVGFLHNDSLIRRRI